MRAKYKNKNGEWIKYHKQSTIWPGIKWVISEVQEGSIWIVGDGKDISVWSDKWIKDYSIIERHSKDEYIMQNKLMKVKDLIYNGEWCIPEVMMQYFDASELPVLVGGKDRRIWSKDKVGKFTVSNATQMIRKKFPAKVWTQQVWQPCIHPYTSKNIWKILRGACATEESSFDEVLNLAKGKNPTVKGVWFICAFNIMVELWFARNVVIYEAEIPSVDKLKRRIHICVKEGSFRMRGKMWGNMLDLHIMLHFGISGVKVKSVRVKQCFFTFPSQNQTLICCDGAYKSNPGKAGIGFIARNHYGEHLGSASGGLGIATNYLAEVMALIIAGEWEISRGLLNVCFSLDSKVVIMAFLNDKMPWMVQSIWVRITKAIPVITFRHSYR
ncbi:uncharacterized protein LOC113342426 [Papaver somniferum]|uniref:uncharacterized protein LOC113342426 n=1 Tax=Papaver somniferum TaxID=3469 RepID=UPI000E6F7248|nr:uncharacterized protein LOC113342426 [Papaver somniferum]